MFMYRILSILIVPLFVSCKSSHVNPSPIRPVKVATVHAIDYVDRDFAGMATADDAVNMAFKIAGQVSSVDVSKGEMVSKGELLARLDPRDVELQVASDRSQYERARSQFERMRRLLDHEAVSRQEYESAQAAYVQAESVYENSKDLLNETRLRAPFAGVIERTYVDAFQRVEAGQTILRLVNPVSTTVEFTMPEKSMILLSESSTRYFVRFDNYPNVNFEARLDTYAKTSSDASGFPVSLKLNKGEIAKYNISPGMTCQVTIRASDKLQSAMSVPLTAIYSPAQGGEYVWCVDADDVVHLRKVQLGDIFGRDMVAVTSGLRSGERVVVAGVYHLRDGQKVRILNN